MLLLIKVEMGRCDWIQNYTALISNINYKLDSKTTLKQ